MSDSDDLAVRFPIDLGGGWRACLTRREDGTISHVGLAAGIPGGWESIYALAIAPNVNGAGASWTLVSESPLTLAPSVHLPGVFHGWIRDGKWVNA